MAKKHLGQNFLKSKKAITTMVSVAEVTKNDVVVEIGPGRGAITKPLVETGARVIALEKDEDLIPLLQDLFKDNSNFELFSDDVLLISPAFFKKYGRTYKVVANIPYYITGAILQHFLESVFQPVSMTLLVQKEVAERIVSRDGKESILSLSVKAYGAPKAVMKVSKSYFSPEPKVDSAVIHIANISKDFFKGFSEQEFFFVVKKAFQFKRKNIGNNLKKSFKNTEEVLCELSISKETRAEDLSLQTFALLAQKLEPSL
jgi:16S rRNA (adenine1518-N6/adenine1519-N6)-dimethyltransferase